MKLTKEQQQLIKDVHKLACSEWKTKIEDGFPKLFEDTKFEGGKWYKPHGERESLWFIEKIYPSGAGCGYGVCKGIWDVSSDIDLPESSCNWKPATESEVFEALKKEAIKRGFKPFMQIESLLGFGIMDLNGRPCDTYSNGELYMGSCVIFKDGKWAEIIKKCPKM